MSQEDTQPQTMTLARLQTRRDLLAIAGWFAALSAVYWAATLLLCDGKPGFPLDDSFIHLQFARNLYEDGLMAFNRGIPSSGSTAPLYPMLLAGFYHVVRDWYAASYILGALCAIGTAFAVYGIMLNWTRRRDLAKWAGVLTVICNPTIIQAYSGMEPAVYSLLFLAGLWLYSTPKQRWPAAFVFAACVWLRPEFMILLPLVMLERAIALRRIEAHRLRRFIRDTAPHVICWTLMLAVYAAYHWHLDKHLLPSTFDAKAVAPGLARPVWMDNLPAALARGHLGHILLAITIWPIVILLSAFITFGINCIPLGFGLKTAFFAPFKDAAPDADHTMAGRRLAAIALIGTPWLRGFTDTFGFVWFQQQRYFAHLTPLLILVVLSALPLMGTVTNRRSGLWNWREKSLALQRRRTYQWAGVSSFLLGILAILAVGNINDMQVRAGQWVHDNTPEDALIATNDIGAIAFFGERRVLDTIGLVEPPIVDHFKQGGKLLDYLEEKAPHYVIVFPNWYKEMTARREILAPVHEFPLDLNVVCGGSKLVVYRPQWETKPSTSSVTIAPILESPQ